MKTSSYLLLGAALAVAVLAVTVAPESYAAFMHPGALGLAALAAGSGGMLVGDIQLLRSKELRAERAKLVEENSKVLAKIGAEKDQARLKELESEWDKRDADIVKLTKDVERAERQEQLEADEARPVHERRSGRQESRQEGRELSADEHREQQKQYWRFLLNGLRFGMEALTPEARAAVRGQYQRIDARELQQMEQRDGLSTTSASGGYTIPALFFKELQNNLLAFGGARARARVITTDGGQSLPIPTVDDTGNKAQIIGEGSSLTSPQDTSFGQVALATFMYRSLLPITLELLQDTAFDMEAWIMEALTTRLARGTNVHFTTGNGTTQPKGFIVSASSGVTGSSASSISSDDLVDLEHSVDPAYRRGPGVSWQMNDGMLKVLKKLKDSQNRPLWLPGFAVKEPDTILGYPYDINQDMAGVQGSNKSLAFGDFSKFAVRDVRSPLIVRANEKFIDQGQIGFYIFSRHGSNTLDAGTDPIKYLTHPSP